MPSPVAAGWTATASRTWTTPGSGPSASTTTGCCTMRGSCWSRLPPTIPGAPIRHRRDHRRSARVGMGAPCAGGRRHGRTARHGTRECAHDRSGAVRRRRLRCSAPQGRYLAVRLRVRIYSSRTRAGFAVSKSMAVKSRDVYRELSMTWTGAEEGDILVSNRQKRKAQVTPRRNPGSPSTRRTRVEVRHRLHTGA